MKVKPWMSYASSQKIETASAEASMSSAGGSEITVGVKSVETPARCS